MELKHRLSYANNKTVPPSRVTWFCKEPIGFDDFKTRISRGEYHGMSAELSMDSLEFHGAETVDKIEIAYVQSIDTVITYDVLTEDNVVVYSGVLDLTTASFNLSEYKSVKVHVGEVGVKTIFNNRSGVEIDLNTKTTIDGEDLLHIPSWVSLAIPQRHLAYTNMLSQDTSAEYKSGIGGDNPHADGFYIGSNRSSYGAICVPLRRSKSNEFGTITNVEQPFAITDIGDGSGIPYIYTPDDDHETKYGTGTVARITSKVVLHVSPKTYISGGASGGSVFFMLTAKGKDDSVSGTPTWVNRSKFANREDFDIELSIDAELPAGDAIQFYIETYVDGGVYYSDIWLTVMDGSYFKMAMFDNLEFETVKAKVLPVFDSLNTIVEAVSENELTLKSEWYKMPLGGGAMKALTNGYKIRGLFTEGEVERNMPLSFKNAIESLDAMDCIGWCFESDNDGKYIRVEPWTWFYKSNLVLSIDNVAIIRDVDPESIITELQIGYTKYATQDEYNSVDSFHGERVYLSNIRGVSKSVSKMCDFIADNYAIEETRRAANGVDSSEEFKYDENIFVLELVGIRGTVPFRYSVSRGIANATDIDRPEEVINMSISPYHNACRWAGRMMATYGVVLPSFASGTINYHASYEKTHAPGLLYLSTVVNEHKENDPLVYNQPRLIRAEKITFDYPISVEQYNAIKANPYGIVRVNGEDCWIKEFTYSFKDGMANFVLMPKFDYE